MTTIADDNTPNKLLVEQASTPSTPAAGKQRVYIRTSDHKLCRVDSSGTVTVIETAGSGIPTTGWVDQTAVTWTRTGNYTFTISGDVTATYRKGTKVRYKDGGSYEYGVVISSTYGAPNTTVTLATNTDYAMAAATITDNYYSHIENPEGFPDWFNYTPSTSASGSMTWTSISVTFAKFKVNGKTVTSVGKVSGTTGGSASTLLNASAPIEAAWSASAPFVISGVIQDAVLEAPRCWLAAGTPDVFAFGRVAGANWGLGASRYISWLAVYEME